ncbi:MAG: MFS transporter AraJ [Breznakibacter sp.]
MKLRFIALAFGTLGLGISEYVMMGILPDIAKDFHISIPKTGHLISYYAIGVCVGAPLMVIFARRLPLKKILLLLMGLFVAGNLFSAMAGSYGTLSIARFVAGLPHGAYFGVGSIVASKLADKGKEGTAVAAMISGMTFANLVGVPLGTFLSNAFSWRITYGIVGLWGIVTVLALWKWVPQVAPLPDGGFKGQFRFLRKWAPWLLMLAIMFGNGGIFCWYSYISKVMTDVSGFSGQYLSVIMVWAGLGMFVGNLASGKLSDKYSPGLVSMATQGTGAVALAFIYLLAKYPVPSLLLTFTCTACLFALSAPQQILLLQNSEGGQMLGASGAQAAFNLGNALGALVGGLPVSMGYGYEATAIPGTLFALFGFGLLYYFYKGQKQPSALVV